MNENKNLTCSCCKSVKSITEFNKNKANRSGFQNQCKACKRITGLSHRSKPETRIKKRSTWLEYKYGITLEVWQELFNAQNGRCAICLRHQSEVTMKFHTDHCHKTGKVRGLLCASCNHTLGQNKDNPEAFDRFAAYLRRNI